MIASSEILEYFDAKILFIEKLEDATFCLFDNRIFLICVNEFARITMEVTKAGTEFILKNGDGGNYYNIFQFKSFSETDPEVREWASGHNSNRISRMDALVISNLSQKILTDFYLKVSRPVLPTKVFTDLRKALEWIKRGIEQDQANSN